jgi:hypothetical protein
MITLAVKLNHAEGTSTVTVESSDAETERELADTIMHEQIARGHEAAVMERITITATGETVFAERYFRANQADRRTPGVAFDQGGPGESTPVVWDKNERPIPVRDGDWIALDATDPERHRVIRGGVEVFAE